jgi:elongation factor P
MLSITDLKTGTFFELDRIPHQVISYEHSKTGRAGAVLRTKIRNLNTGAVVERTFKGSDQFEEADIARKKGQYLYSDGTNATFMEADTFEQHEMPLMRLGTDAKYLKDGMELDIVLYNDNILAIILPAKVDLEITYTEPGFKGDTQSGTLKPATLETGLEVNVPLFIKQGEIVRISTATGEYVERVTQSS